MPVIRDHLEEIILSTWGPGDEKEVLSYIGDVPLTRQDFRTLSYPNAPSSKVIDCYLSLIVDRRTSTYFPSVFAFNSLFHRALSTKRSCKAMAWIKKLNIFSYDLIFVPLYYGNCWSLLSINNYSKCIHLYRDMDKVGKKCVDKVLNYLKTEMHMKNNEYKFSFGMDFLQHRDECDTSVYFLVLVEYLSRNAALTFTQEHMPYFRRKFTYELRTGQICMTHSMLFYGIENTKLPINLAESKGLEKEVVCTIRHIELTKQDFYSLEDHNWLNHNIIDGYITLLVERSVEDGLPTICACSSNAFDYLMKIGTPFAQQRDNIREVNCDILLMPVLHERHWSLIAVDNRSREIQYYNSAFDQVFPYLPFFKNYLKYIMPSRQAETSQYVLTMLSDCPQQTESNDSGVFLLMFAEHIARDAKIVFDHKHVPYFRRKIGYELEASELLRQSDGYEPFKDVPSSASPKKVHVEPKIPEECVQQTEKRMCADKRCSPSKTVSASFKDFQSSSVVITSSALPTLSEEIVTVVHSAWNASNENVVMSIINGATLLRKNFLTLPDNVALDFQIVDAYITLLAERSCMQEGFPSVYNFASAFTKIIATPKDFPSEMDVSLFSFDIALCPIKFKQFWALVSIDNRARKIMHYNLLPDIAASITDVLKRYVTNEGLRMKINGEAYSVEHLRGIPLPGKHCDSGVFILAIAECLSRSAQIFISSELVPYFRRKITYELLSATILTVSVKQTEHSDEDKDISFQITDVRPKDMPIITKKMDAVILTSQGLENKRQILCKIGNIWLTRMDFLSLQSRHWLSNEVINTYMTLIMERGKLENFPSVYALNSGFSEILRTSGPKGVMKKAENVCIFTYDLIIIPMNLKDFWTLVVIDNKYKKVRLYHKLCDATYEVVTSIREYLRAEGQRMQIDMRNIDDYVSETARNLPELGNPYETKLSVLIFAEYVTRRACIRFKREFVPYFRKKIAYELRTGKLLETRNEDAVSKEAAVPEPVSSDDLQLLIPICGDNEKEESFRVAPHSKRKAPKMELVRSFKKLKLVKEDIFILNSADSALSPVLVFCYFLLIHERSLESSYPSVYPFPSAFFDTLAAKKEFSKLTEFTKNTNLFIYDLLLVPVCSGGHWSLLVVDNRSRHIRYYDSNGRSGFDAMKLLSAYLAGKVKEKQSKEYKLEAVKNLPQQENESDSGVLMLLYAECLTRDGKVTLNQNSVMYYRKKMSLELLYIELNRCK